MRRKQLEVTAQDRAELCDRLGIDNTLLEEAHDAAISGLYAGEWFPAKLVQERDGSYYDACRWLPLALPRLYRSTFITESNTVDLLEVKNYLALYMIRRVAGEPFPPPTKFVPLSDTSNYRLPPNNPDSPDSSPLPPPEAVKPPMPSIPSPSELA